MSKLDNIYEKLSEKYELPPEKIEEIVKESK